VNLDCRSVFRKFLVAGTDVQEVELSPIKVTDSLVSSVRQFPYFASCRCAVDVDNRLARASRAFGAVRCVLLDANIRLPTRRLIYSACILSVLLYGSECWCLLKPQLRKLESFTNAASV